MEYYDVIRLRCELKELVDRQDIYVVIESHIEDEAKSFILEETVDFTKEAIENLHRKLSYRVNVSEDANDVVVTIRIAKKSCNQDTQNITEIYSETTENKVLTNQHVFSPLPSLSIKI